MRACVLDTLANDGEGAWTPQLMRACVLANEMVVKSGRAEVTR